MTQLTKNIHSVSSLTYEIKHLFEQKFSLIKVKGEVSNFKKQKSGHIYFTLKDRSCAISVALFAGYAKSNPTIKDGDEIVVEGEISVYAPRGSYQIIAKKIEKSGVGDLLLKLHQLKEELKNKGYFDPEKKKKLPLFPKKIGVVTSGTGAVICDIINVLSRRYPNFQLVLNPVAVQGKGAEYQIANAIKEFNDHNIVDVLIVGRGGGSLEDLFCFNEKMVAEAIYQSKIPIISAVGHETDFTIADLVADVRAPTPSAAAEIAVREKKQVKEKMRDLQERLKKHTLTKIQHLRTHLEKTKATPCFSSPYSMLSIFIQRIDSITSFLDQSFIEALKKKQALLTEKKKSWALCSPIKKIHAEKTHIEQIQQHLKSINPKNLLKKGYSLVYDKNQQKLLRSIEAVKNSGEISIQLSNGSVFATYNQVKEEKNE